MKQPFRLSIQFTNCKKLYQYNNTLKRYIHKSDDVITHNVKNNLVDKTPITAQLW